RSRKGDQHGKPAGSEELLHIVIFLVLSWHGSPRQRTIATCVMGADNWQWTCHKNHPHPGKPRYLDP
ncbi:MAG: hypothetical protein ACRC5D_06755, partial [Aeromonas allosaccharophila]